jgi:hypothetical protein
VPSPNSLLGVGDDWGGPFKMLGVRIARGGGVAVRQAGRARPTVGSTEGVMPPPRCQQSVCLPLLQSMGRKQRGRCHGSSARTRALEMVRKLHRDSEAVWRGGSLMMWCPIEIIVRRPTDVDALAFAVVQGWIEMSPGTQNVRVTDEGRRAAQA